eukprot:5041068-Lingulodinium_polyedra.AAC.1
MELSPRRAVATVRARGPRTGPRVMPLLSAWPGRRRTAEAGAPKRRWTCRQSQGPPARPGQ